MPTVLGRLAETAKYIRHAGSASPSTVLHVDTDLPTAKTRASRSEVQPGHKWVGEKRSGREEEWVLAILKVTTIHQTLSTNLM
jgi:hypothetical protein